MNEENIQLPVMEQKEGLKLIKNTKGYNWEIKTLDLDIDRLEKLNIEMVKRFGVENDKSSSI